MASTPWGMAAEDAWNRANMMRLETEKQPSYDLRCIFCQHKVFMVEDEIARMEGHIYSDAGKAEYGMTRICEYCFDKTADSMDGVPPNYFVKRFPQDSLSAWRGSWGTETPGIIITDNVFEPEYEPDDDLWPEDSNYEWGR
jgi:hypothetical protein